MPTERHRPSRLLLIHLRFKMKNFLCIIAIVFLPATLQGQQVERFSRFSNLEAASVWEAPPLSSRPELSPPARIALGSLAGAAVTGVATVLALRPFTTEGGSCDDGGCGWPLVAGAGVAGLVGAPLGAHWGGGGRGNLLWPVAGSFAATVSAVAVGTTWTEDFAVLGAAGAMAGVVSSIGIQLLLK